MLSRIFNFVNPNNGSVNTYEDPALLKGLCTGVGRVLEYPLFIYLFN